MFNMMCGTVFFASYSNFFGLSNISLSYFDILITYIIAIICSIGAALALKMPLMPGKLYRYSFDVSAIYPTPIIAMGLLSIFLVLNYTFIYNGLFLAVIIGFLSAFFVKYLFYIVFPKPLDENDGEDIDE